MLLDYCLKAFFILTKLKGLDLVFDKAKYIPSIRGKYTAVLP